MHDILEGHRSIDTYESKPGLILEKEKKKRQGNFSVHRLLISIQFVNNFYKNNPFIWNLTEFRRSERMFDYNDDGKYYSVLLKMYEIILLDYSSLGILLNDPNF